MLPKIEMVKKLNEKYFYTGEAVAITQKTVKKGKISTFEESRSEPFKCRLSFYTGSKENSPLGATESQKGLLLFTPSEIVIPEGSKIEITQNEITHTVESSGIPSIYDTHREYTVKEVVKYQ